MEVVSSILVLVAIVRPLQAICDISDQVFGSDRELSPAAWCDFNADEFLDLVVIRGDKKTVEVLFGESGDPTRFTPCRKTRCTGRGIITSVAAGDFDGDAFLDLMVTTREASASEYTAVYILWGNLTDVDCTPFDSNPLIQLRCQPLVFDADGDMITDLFGLDENEDRMIWRMYGRHGVSKIAVQLDPPSRFTRMHIPHSNAFLDMDGDCFTDLIVTTTESYEVWLNRGEDGFIMNGTNDISLPPPPVKILGQSQFLDVNLDGNIEYIVPVCYDQSCLQSNILIYSSGEWYNANVSFVDSHGIIWGFLPPVADDSQYFNTAITLRSGDLNMDGYPDFICTLQSEAGKISAFLLLNIPTFEKSHKRSFRVMWDAFGDLNENTQAGVMVDLSNNGALDVVLVRNTTPPTVLAVRDILNVTGTFLKTTVVSARNNDILNEPPPLLSHSRGLLSPPFPGPSVRYSSNRLDRDCQNTYAGQQSQSAYFALQLPYVLLGLGWRPNFLDHVEVSYAGQVHRWPDIIPNSQLVVKPASALSYDWGMRQYIKPNKMMLNPLGIMSCLFIILAMLLIILNFIEKANQESEFFHFHAM